MNEIIIRNPDPTEHETDGKSLVMQANEVAILDHDDRSLAGGFQNMLDDKIKLIEREFDGTDENPGPVSLAHKAWKSGVALRERALFQFKQAKTIIQTKIRKFEYDTEQKRLAEAQAAQAKAQEEAEERRRLEIEAARKRRDKEAVSALKEAPLEVVAAAPVTQEVPKVDGMRRSAPIWSWEYTNQALIPDDLWQPNEKEITARVKRLGGKANIPGISVFDARSRGV